MSIAVILANMGGPDSIEAVEPFLYQIFKDKDIIDIPLSAFLRDRFARWLARRRSPESRHIYEKLGGKTPLTDIAYEQARLVQQSLNRNNTAKYQVFTAMRYWHPFMEDVWHTIVSQNFDRLVVVSLYPFYSTTTTGSLEKLVRRLNERTPFHGKHLNIVTRFGSHPMFIQTIVRQIESALAASSETEFRDILFSAHSIPMGRINQGDPYQREVEQTIAQIRQQLSGKLNIHLSYQSKLGPVKWLGPSTPDKIKELAANGVRNLLVYPMGFVADNSETVYEIGMLYRELAESLGLKKFLRIEALNTNAEFIATLQSIVLEQIKEIQSAEQRPA